MKVLIYSDIHADYRALDQILTHPADFYVLAGDLTLFGRGLNSAGEKLHSLGERLWMMPGNHETEAEIAEFCNKHGFLFFHRAVLKRGDVNFAGLGYSNPTPFNTPGEYTEERIAQELEAFRGLDNLVLICHCPPYGTRLDEVSPGRHTGSPVLRAFVEKEQPRYLICGHIHECQGKEDLIGETYCFNAGKLGYLLEI